MKNKRERKGGEQGKGKVRKAGKRWEGQQEGRQKRKKRKERKKFFQTTTVLQYFLLGA